MNLTPRQSEVVSGLIRSQGDRGIATNLNIAERTVRAHLDHLYARHRVSDRISLVVRVFEIVLNPESDPSGIVESDNVETANCGASRQRR